MRRGINLEVVSAYKIVLQFDIYMQDPDFEVDVMIFAVLSTFTHIVLDYDSLDQALKKRHNQF